MGCSASIKWITERGKLAAESWLCRVRNQNKWCSCLIRTASIINCGTRIGTRLCCSHIILVLYFGNHYRWSVCLLLWELHHTWTLRSGEKETHGIIWWCGMNLKERSFQQPKEHDVNNPWRVLMMLVGTAHVMADMVGCNLSWCGCPFSIRMNGTSFEGPIHANFDCASCVPYILGVGWKQVVVTYQPKLGFVCKRMEVWNLECLTTTMSFNRNLFWTCW